MRNVRSANYVYIDHEEKRKSEGKGIKIFSTSDAWEKFRWIRKFIKEKPKEGYFIWVKEPQRKPLNVCISIASRGIKQDLKNVLVLDKNVKAKAVVVCNALQEGLSACHSAKGVAILRKNAVLEYNHSHVWGKNDKVEIDYKFILEERSKLSYMFKSLKPLKLNKITTTVEGFEKSSANFDVSIVGENSTVLLNESVFLKGEGTNGTLRLRLVGKKGSRIQAISRIVAEAEGKGHLDCRGLMVDKNSFMKLVPELINKNKDALLTHEASIGRISEEELNYLRARGLSEREAIDFIVSGFLG
jgi:hypothetical protein